MKNLHLAKPIIWAKPLLVMSILSFAGMINAQTTGNAIEITRVDSKDAKIAHVNVQSLAGNLAVNGYIKKTFQRRGHIPGHLHIEAYNDAGKLLMNKETDYRRLNRQAKQSRFSETLAVQSGDVARVRVVHHGLGDSQG